MTEERSKLAQFYIGFNGDFRGVCRLVPVTVECSVNDSHCNATVSSADNR